MNPCQVKLAKWLKERTRDWRFDRADGTPVRLLPPGDVLSGEKLVNSREFRDWLAHRFPSGLGGEMEGIGAYAANQRYGPCEILLDQGDLRLGGRLQERNPSTSLRHRCALV